MTKCLAVGHLTQIAGETCAAENLTVGAFI